MMYILKDTLRSNDDKRLQTFNSITSYPYGASAGKVCKIELLSKVKYSKYKLIILIITLMKI